MEARVESRARLTEQEITAYAALWAVSCRLGVVEAVFRKAIKSGTYWVMAEKRTLELHELVCIVRGEEDFERGCEMILAHITPWWAWHPTQVLDIGMLDHPSAFGKVCAELYVGTTLNNFPAT